MIYNFLHLSLLRIHHELFWFLDMHNMPEGNGKKEEKKLKPCCACPETKKVRDECVIEKGEENCKSLIEAHKECMRKLGFKI